MPCRTFGKSCGCDVAGSTDNLDAYIYTALRNLCIDRIRSRRMRQEKAGGLKPPPRAG